MCLDQEWQKWLHAYMNEKTPETSRLGFAYMLIGDKGGSNTDPYARAPTAEINGWLRRHI